MKKHFLPLLLVLALVMTFVASASGTSTTTIYLLAVNDKLCDLPGNNLPLSYNGVIYVPYNTFDKDSTGTDVGVYYGLIQDRNTILTLYSLSGSLAFDIYHHTCTDNQGNQMGVEYQAIRRNGIPYVPAAAVCSFFGLQYSFLPTADRGTLIRICNASATIDNNQFLSSATLQMTTRYNNLLQSRNPQPSPSATPASPTPTATPAGGRDSKENVWVYLSLDASSTESDLTTLFPDGIRALFLFTPDSLAARSTQVRKAVAAGHSVGFIVDGDGETALAALERGNELLSHIARTQTRIVSAPASLTSTLTAAGWSCWSADLRGTNASAILSTLDLRRSSARIHLPASPVVVSRVIAGLREDGYTLRQPLETEL